MGTAKPPVGLAEPAERSGEGRYLLDPVHARQYADKFESLRLALEFWRRRLGRPHRRAEALAAPARVPRWSFCGPRPIECLGRPGPTLNTLLATACSRGGRLRGVGRVGAPGHAGPVRPVSSLGMAAIGG